MQAPCEPRCAAPRRAPWLSTAAPDRLALLLRACLGGGSAAPVACAGPRPRQSGTCSRAAPPSSAPPGRIDREAVGIEKRLERAARAAISSYGCRCCPRPRSPCVTPSERPSRRRSSGRAGPGAQAGTAIDRRLATKASAFVAASSRACAIDASPPGIPRRAPDAGERAQEVEGALGAREPVDLAAGLHQVGGDLAKVERSRYREEQREHGAQHQQLLPDVQPVQCAAPALAHG